MTEYMAQVIWLPTLAMVIARAMGIFLVAPVFSHAAVPVRLRVLMAVVIGLAATAQIARPVELAGEVDFVLGLVLELAVGALIGYAAVVIFAAVELGASYISQQMGLGMADVIDPLRETSGDSIRNFYNLLAVVVFLAIGGHRVMIASLLGSFQTVPLAGLALGMGAIKMVAALLAASFVLALKVAAPVLAAMLLATAAMALLARALPQCNFLTTGLPARAILGLVVLAVAVASVVPLMQSAVGTIFSNLPAVLGTGTSR